MNQSLKYLLLSLSLAVLLGCKSNDLISKRREEFKTNPKLLFLNYTIEKLTNDSLKVEVLNHKTVDGKMKDFNSVEKPTNNDLVCAQWDKKSKILEEHIIQNPLIKHFEALNDSLSFESKTIQLNKANFSVRLQLKPDTEYIIIRKFDKSQVLIKTKIQ